MNKPKTVICPAFKFVFSSCEEIVLSINYEMNDYARSLYLKDGLTGFFKGFVTNTGDFVDAKTAEIIAGLAGQFKSVCGEYYVEKWCFDRLLSERKDKGVESVDVFAIPFDQSFNKNYKIIPIGLGLKPENLY